MKTVTIKLPKSEYKAIKKLAKRYDLSIEDYIMIMHKERTEKLSDMDIENIIDQIFYDCTFVTEAEELENEVKDMVTMKAEEVIEYLQNKEEM